MKKSLLLFSIFSYFFFLNSSVQASRLTREQMMQREMDCISQESQASSLIDWQDVCYTYEAAQENIQPTQLQHNKEVKQALDQHDTVGIPTPTAVKPAKPAEMQNQTIPQEEVPSIVHKEHEFEIGTELSNIVYKEPIFDLKDEGMMYGIFGVYTFRPQSNELIGTDIINMYRMDGKFSYGLVDYSSVSGSIDGIPDYLFEVRGVAGYEFKPAEDFQTTPYLGLGYRRLNDDSSGKSTQSGANGYQRIANYVYMPIGLELKHQLDHSWSIGGTGEFDIFLWGLQESFLSDVSTIYPDVTNNQHKGFGLRASLELMKKSDRYNFLIEPFIRYWHIKDSNLDYAVGPTGVVLGGTEPDNNSTEIGLKLGAQF